MNEREAQEITRMVESGWSSDFGIQGRTLWCSMLYPYGAELATQAVIEMSKHPLPGGRFKPQVSDLRAIILSLKARQEVPKQLTSSNQERRGVAAPEWVWVWSWARNQRDPRVTSFFPQQQPNANPEDTMSAEAYDALLAEWVDAGSPKSATPIPMARG